MAIRTQTGMQTQINTLLSDNSTGDVTGTDIISVTTDLNDTLFDLVNPKIYVLDVFSDADGTTMPSHLPNVSSGASWAVLNGGFKISGGKCVSTQQAPAGAGKNIVAIDAGVSDCVISCTYKSNAPTGHNSGLAFRIVDKDNFWMITSVGTDFELYEASAGSLTIRGTVSVSGSRTGETYKVTLSGSDISCETIGLSTNVSLTYTSTLHQTATKHGFRIYEGLPTYTAELGEFIVLPL